jgi:hypothetical protein
VGKLEGKNYLKDQGVDGIKMDLREIGWGGGVEWIHLAVANVVTKLRVLAPWS